MKNRKLIYFPDEVSDSLAQEKNQTAFIVEAVKEKLMVSDNLDVLKQKIVFINLKKNKLQLEYESGVKDLMNQEKELNEKIVDLGNRKTSTIATSNQPLDFVELINKFNQWFWKQDVDARFKFDEKFRLYRNESETKPEFAIRQNIWKPDSNG